MDPSGEGVRGWALTQDSYVASFAENCQIGVLRSFSKKEQNYERVIKMGQKNGTILVEVR